MNRSATQAAVVVLGLAVATQPSWAHPVLPLSTLVVQQAENKKDPQREADDLLRRARAAMRSGNVELAERFVTRAEKLNVSYDKFLSRFVDTPQKARKDLEKLKASGGNRKGLLPGLFGGNKPAAIPQDPLARPADAAGPNAPQRLPADAIGNVKQLELGPGVGYPSTGQASLLGNAGRPQLNDVAVGTPQQIEEEAKRLAAQANAALARGDLDLSENLAQKAYNLRVADKAFQGGDTPWELLMKISKQRRLQGSNAGPGVARALYDPRSDNSYVRTASAEQPAPPTDALAQQFPGLEPVGGQAGPAGIPSDDSAFGPSAEPQLAPTPEPTSVFGGDVDLSPEASTLPNLTTGASPTSTGVIPSDLVRQGEAAVAAGRLNEARDLFRQAWSHEQQLDPTTRQRLQEHLQMLSVDRNPVAPPTADQAEQLRVRRLMSEVSREQAEIARTLANSPRVTWERMKQLRSRIDGEDLPDAARRPLVARLDRAVSDIERFIEQNRAKIELDEQNRDVLAAIDRDRKLRQEVSEKLAKMVDEFNGLMDQQRYSEAYILAKQARDLDPRHPVVENMVWKSRFAERMFVELSLRDRHAIGLEKSLESAYESGIGFDDREPIEFPQKWGQLTKIRRGFLADNRSRFTEVEREIQRALRKRILVDFENAPLASVISTLGKMADINVHLDAQGLSAEGATSDTPVSISLPQEIALQSALNLILEPLNLGYIIQDEVLRITSAEAREGDVYQEVYYVGDLVIPIPNFMPGYQSGMAGALAQAHAALGYGGGYGARQAPLAVLADDEGEKQPLGKEASVLAQLSAAGMASPGQGAPQPLGFGPGGLGGASMADFDTLMQLISSTVAPDSWDEVGGPGSMAPFEGNLSLVISNTQQVHEEIVDLLEQLRRLQDLQVTIEVRFITLQDNFFERIGIDFDFDVRDGSGLTQQDISDATEAGTDENLDLTIGLDPNGNPTLDLDLSFNQNTFGGAIPTFGGFDPAAASTFGFAILSDIEAFFVMEAIQGDRRTNVMQAPKITLFNGQFTNINDTSSRPFVTSVIPVVGDFAAAQQPVILVLAEGTQLNVQAVVSSDRRFVRLTLLPMFSQIGDVDTFTFEGSRSTTNTSSSEVDPETENTTATNSNAEEFTQGTTVQLPTFAITSVSTTVSVPDGGTVLLGGIKRLAEGRNERGMPILGKLPYISRLFKNVGIGRETQTLMMMVTPRIIIQEEEEERILGTPAP